MSKLKNARRCDRCGATYDTSPYANMAANGTYNYTTIEIYEKKYDLCPLCTANLYQFIKKKEELKQ